MPKRPCVNRGGVGGNFDEHHAMNPIDPLDINDKSLEAMIRLGNRPDLGLTRNELHVSGISGPCLKPMVQLGWLSYSLDDKRVDHRNASGMAKLGRYRITEKGQALVRELVGEMRKRVDAREGFVYVTTNSIASSGNNAARFHNP